MTVTKTPSGPSARHTQAVRRRSDIIEAPPLTVWPTVERHCRLPADVEAFVRQLNAPSDERLGTDRSAQP